MNTLSITSTSIFLPALLVMAGMSFFAGINQFFLWLKQRDSRSYLAFAFVCLVATCYILLQYAYYTVASIEDAAKVWQNRDLVIPLFFLSYGWFFFLYIKKKPNSFLYIYSSLWIFLFIITLFLPQGHVNETITGIYTKTLPWGETLSMIEGDLNIYLGPLDFVLSLSIFLFHLYAGPAVYREQNKIKGISIIIIGIIWLFSNANDILLDLKVINSIYTGEFVVMAIVLAFTYNLAYEWYILKVKFLQKDLELLKEKKESEQRYRSFFETARDGAFVTSLEGRFLDFNQGFVDLFGYESKDELKQIDVVELYANPDDRAKVIQKIIDHGFTAHLPITFRKKDGSLIDTLMTSSVIKNSAGEIEALHGTITDISERTLAEQALKESEERFRLLSDLSREGIAIHREGYVLEVNKALCEIFDYTADELIGTNPIEKIFTSESVNKVRDFLLSDYTHEYELEVLRGMVP